jgi:hypothetical protein
MKKAGTALLLADGGNEVKKAEAFRVVFSEYIKQTKTYLFYFASGDNAIGAIYEQLLSQKKIIENLNKELDRIKNTADNLGKLMVALRKILPVLLPRRITVSEQTRLTLATEIVARLNLTFPADTIAKIVRSAITSTKEEK